MFSFYIGWPEDQAGNRPGLFSPLNCPGLPGKPDETDKYLLLYYKCSIQDVKENRSATWEQSISDQEISDQLISLIIDPLTDKITDGSIKYFLIPDSRSLLT